MSFIAVFCEEPFAKGLATGWKGTDMSYWLMQVGIVLLSHMWKTWLNCKIVHYATVTLAMLGIVQKCYLYHNNDTVVETAPGSSGQVSFVLTLLYKTTLIIDVYFIRSN